MQVVDFDQPVGITWEQTSGAIQLAVDAIKRGDIDEADAEVTMPFGTDVRNDDRLRIGGAVYEVTSQPRDERRLQGCGAGHSPQEG